MNKIKVVVMGGGTGIHPVVSALKDLPVDISVIVATSDSGGSTGRIRDEFGFPPVGDLRQSLAALAKEGSQSQIRDLLLYRFDSQGNLNGHNLGNLILTALQDIHEGSTVAALKAATQIFRLKGQVIPVTDQSVDLEITYQDGSVAVGEHILDKTTAHPKKIKSVKLVPACQVTSAAVAAIKKADLIMIGPGDYYASLMAVLVTPGLKKVLSQTKADILYTLNLMTRNTQTQDMNANDHVVGIEEAIGRHISKILINNASIPKEILDSYAAEAEFPVEDNLTTDKRVIRAPLVDLKKHVTAQNDTAHRSLLRHSKQKLARVYKDIL